LLAESQPGRGALSSSKRKLLENVFDYTHRSAKHIMVPRAEIVYLTLRQSLAENLDVIRKNQHTRYPLCETDIDHVVGMIHTKDLFQPEEGLRDSRDLLRLKREILFVPETRPARAPAARLPAASSPHGARRRRVRRGPPAW